MNEINPNHPKVGDRVKVVVPPHMPGHTTGTVRQVVGDALGIEFDATPGAVHQWYVPSEVMVITDETSAEETDGAPMGKAHPMLGAFPASIWGILPDKLAELRDCFQRKARGERVEPESGLHAHGKPEAAVRRPDGVQMVGRVAVLQIFGAIDQRANWWAGASTEQIGATLDSLVKDAGVRSIVLQIDSPGGVVSGVPELAERIRAARDSKKIVAFVDPTAASAAYWLASQATEIVVTPSGWVGSIGVITAHDDCTGALEKMGIKTTLIASTPFKGERWPETPLSDEARAAIQAEVDFYHKMFVAAVAKGRGVPATKVEKDFGQGRMVLAQEAVARGMADRIGTIDQVLKRLGAAEGTNAALAAARARVLEISD